MKTYTAGLPIFTFFVKERRKPFILAEHPLHYVGTLFVRLEIHAI
jgi:hypothetical protein